MLKIQQGNRFAFKEWAAVCGALATGKQSLIIRKGGIHEGRDGFRVEHPEFWLFPTQFHQDPEQLVDDARPQLETARRDRPDQGTLRISLYATVEEAVHVTDESLLPQLAGLHILSPHVIGERFHYRTPGLFVLPVRIYQLPKPIVLPDTPHFAGCRSWVDFPQELSTDGLDPVLSDDDHRQRMAQIRQALAISRIV
ncbi:MAG: DUF1802 family protein [Planctomycetaceae bacterium]